MSALDEWRQQIRPLIPRGFLRRDQGQGLLISDFPRFDGKEAVIAALERAGFTVSLEGSVARIDGNTRRYLQLQERLLVFEDIPDDGALPLWALGQRLARASVPLEDQPRFALHLTLKCLDAGEEEALLRLLPPCLAVLQRQHQPLPALAGALILDHLARKTKGAMDRC